MVTATPPAKVPMVSPWMSWTVAGEPFTLAWRNLWRHTRRTVITVVAMCAGLVFCLGMTTMLDGMYRDLFDTAVTETLGHARIHHPEYPKKRAMWETNQGGEALVGARLAALVPPSCWRACSDGRAGAAHAARARAPPLAAIAP
jgi:hypothetical protein